MDDLITLKKQSFSHLGQGSRLTGEFFLSGVTKIASQMSGTIQMEEGSSLTIAHEGNFQGTIHCGNLDIFGEVSGEIFSTGRVSFHPCSVFHGKLKSVGISIFPGAVVDMEGATETPPLTLQN